MISSHRVLRPINEARARDLAMDASRDIYMYPQMTLRSPTAIPIAVYHYARQHLTWYCAFFAITHPI
jgi:hypothetical protein